MRTVGAALLVLIALILAGVALPGAWIERNLVQADGFVELAGPLGADPDFQARLTDALATEATAAAELPPAFAGIIEPLIADAAATVAALPGYPAAWDDTLRRSHDLSVPTEVNVSTGVESPQPLRLDLTPVVSLALQEVGSGIGIEVPEPAETLIEIGPAEQQVALGQLAAISGLWPFLLTAAGMTALLALVLARRRGTTLALLGVGIAVLGGIYWLASGAAPGGAEQLRAQNADAESPIAALFREGLVARAVEDAQPLSLAVFGLGVVLCVMGVAARLLAGGRTRTQQD
ncbi:hypothetical protein [Arthrobacter sp. CAN_C5]|uniref:hypothetical protein n=1 Tax=Arthrobacter sp. CAN_C5 TaxID=2760706 RepID=UPI001AE90AA7|nr:hypothetical protein [Arthrobacter sp. CAN_C5]MBP2215812.1 hypothetical protein [Arthrobacter sp. CAN_C5]